MDEDVDLYGYYEDDFMDQSNEDLDPEDIEELEEVLYGYDYSE